MSVSACGRDAGSTEIGFPTRGVSASGGGDVDVVIVAEPAWLRTIGRVVDAAPNRVLHPESARVLQHERDDLVSEGDAFGAAGVGNHHVDGQAEGMPWQRIRSHAPDFVNLGERRTDGTLRQDGSDL